MNTEDTITRFLTHPDLQGVLTLYFVDKLERHEFLEKMDLIKESAQMSRVVPLKTEETDEHETHLGSA